MIQLKSAVVEDFDASNWRELGALTNTIDEVENHPSLLRSLSWGDRDYFATQLDPDMLRDLRSCLQTGTPLGNDRFRARIEQAPGGVKVIEPRPACRAGKDL